MFFDESAIEKQARSGMRLWIADEEYAGSEAAQENMSSQLV